MKKKILLFALVVATILSCLPINAFSAEITFNSSNESFIPIEGTDVMYRLTDGVLELKGGSIPYKFYTMISDYYDKDSVAEIIFDSSVTYIDFKAFLGYHNLESVVLPKGIEVAFDVFYDCPKLDEVCYMTSEKVFNKFFKSKILDTTLLAAEFVFVTDTSVCDHVLDTNATKCSLCGLEYGVCAKNVKYIYDSKTYTITVFGTGAIPNYAASDINPAPWSPAYGDLIEHIIVSEGITAIGDRAFKELTDVKTITLPTSLTSIGELAFAGCKMKSIVIAKNVNEIGHWALIGCPSLESIVVDPENTNFYTVDGILYERGAYGDILRRCPMALNVLDVVIPDNVIRIQDSSFLRCEKIKSVTIPGSVNGIEKEAFRGCFALETLTMEEGVTEIGVCSFAECISLVNINIPKSLERIEQAAFQLCLSLKEVKIPQNVTYIGEYAFDGCESLTDVYLPSSLMEMGASLFNSCPNIRSISLSDGMTEIAEGMFRDCTGLTTVMIPETVEMVKPEAFYNCPSLAVVTFTGSEEEWNEVAIMGGNEALLDAEVICIGDNNVDAFEIFGDLKDNGWSKDAINYVVSHNLMKGTSATTFDQEGTMTRAMIVTVLWRMEGQPVPSIANPFDDFDPSQEWYHTAAVWAYERGIVKGTSATTFNPDGAVTREEITTFLFRYAKYKGYDTNVSYDISSFPDAVSVSDWAYEALSWANEKGIVAGSDQGGVVMLLPQTKATREQVATILTRICNIFDK